MKLKGVTRRRKKRKHYLGKVMSIKPNTFVSCCHGNKIQIWDSKTFAPVKSMTAPFGSLSKALYITKNKKWKDHIFVVSYGKNDLLIYDKNGGLVKTVSNLISTTYCLIEVDERRFMLGSRSSPHCLKMFLFSDFRAVQTRNYSSTMYDLAEMNNQRVAVTVANTEVEILKWNKGDNNLTLVKKLSGHTRGTLYRCGFDPKMNILVSSIHSNKEVCIWDATTYNLIKKVFLTFQPYRGLTFLDKRIILGGYTNGNIAVYTREGNLKYEFGGLGVTCIEYLGRMKGEKNKIIATSGNGKILIVNVETKVAEKTLSGQHGSGRIEHFSYRGGDGHFSGVDEIDFFKLIVKEPTLQTTDRTVKTKKKEFFTFKFKNSKEIVEVDLEFLENMSPSINKLLKKGRKMMKLEHSDVKPAKALAAWLKTKKVSYANIDELIECALFSSTLQLVPWSIQLAKSLEMKKDLKQMIAVLFKLDELGRKKCSLYAQCLILFQKNHQSIIMNHISYLLSVKTQKTSELYTYLLSKLTIEKLDLLENHKEFKVLAPEHRMKTTKLFDKRTKNVAIECCDGMFVLAHYDVLQTNNFFQDLLKTSFGSLVKVDFPSKVCVFLLVEIYKQHVPVYTYTDLILTELVQLKFYASECDLSNLYKIICKVIDNYDLSIVQEEELSKSLLSLQEEIMELSLAFKAFEEQGSNVQQPESFGTVDQGGVTSSGLTMQDYTSLIETGQVS